MSRELNSANLVLEMDDRSRILKNREELQKAEDFSSYRFQLQNRKRSQKLKDFFLLTPEEEHGIASTIRLNVGTTPYYLLLADPFDPNCPIRKTIIPSSQETILSPEESPDPLHEERLSPVKGLTHMYPDRVLLFSNHECAVYCRHCMRGRKVSFGEERMDAEDLHSAFAYIRNHPQIRDVVISGGDPLNLSNAKLEMILGTLEKIPHVEICRLGTRNPVTMPMRIDEELCAILEKYNTDNLSIFCNTQFNHPKECTKEAKEAVLKLLKCGVSVGNQAVLLKDINDDPQTMLTLHQKLLGMRVRAYYLYDAELIPGSRGFRVPLHKGIEIMEFLRGKIAGMGIPQFVNDLPGGGGKVPVSPNFYVGYHQKTRTHVFQSSITKRYHFSFEPYSATEFAGYPPISEELWEEIQENAKRENSESGKTS